MSEPLGLWMTVEETTSGTITRRWQVFDRRGGVLGEVKFFGRWRQFCFFPSTNAVFNEGCLADLTKFLNERTAEWRAMKRP